MTTLLAVGAYLHEDSPLILVQPPGEDETREYFRIRPLVIQEMLWHLEIQGDRVECTTNSLNPGMMFTGKRNPITIFSRAARLRMLKLVASMDWPSRPRGLFITLTYPDRSWPRDARLLNTDLDRFHDYLERFTDKKISLMWRKEWKPRLTGRHVGKWLPHFHLIVFGPRFIAKEMIREWWRTITATAEDADLCTDVDSLTSKRKFAVYIAKYCAKLRSTLDYGSYPKTEGRHWGTLRRRGLPFAPLTRVENLSVQSIKTLQTIAAHVLPDYRPGIDSGFTLLAKNSIEWADAIRSLLVDNGDSKA